jgi:hypothetical protein
MRLESSRSTAMAVKIEEVEEEEYGYDEEEI